MEIDIYLCVFFVFFSGVSSQNVTINEDTVDVINNALGQVTCRLEGTCLGISWYLSGMKEQLATTFIGVAHSCLNRTIGYYQTCDDQNHQFTLYFIGTTNLHGQTLRCSGEGCTPEEAVSDTVTISILYGPASISYQPGIKSYTRNEGEILGPIECVSDCNPKCNFVWTRPGQSDYNGKNLTISGITRRQEGDYKCTARNSYGSITGSKISVVVNYGPDPVTLTPPTYSYFVNETFQLGPITCFATCKPACSYKWIITNQNDIQGDTLTVNNIQRTQAGTYKCQAYNAVGTRNSNDVSVIVHYAARLTSMEISDGNNFTIPEHSSKTITCLAEGLPQAKITLNNISNSSIIKSVYGLRLNFTFPSARCEDTGIYKCNAVNMFTSRQSLQTEVFVLCQPRAATGSLQNWYALSVGTTLNITVPYLAYPRPIFQWYKNDSIGSSIQITDDQEDVQIKNFAINTYTYVTQFIRKNLKENEFGTYILSSSNIIGGNEDVYIVAAKDVPDTVASTGVTAGVGAGLGSVIVIIIIVVIVIFVVRRFKGGMTKGKRDVEMNRESSLKSGDYQEDGTRDMILNEPSGPNVVKPGTFGGASAGIPGGANGGQDDYPYAEIHKNGKSELNNPVPVYAEVQKGLKKEKKPDPSAVYVDNGAKPKKKFEKEKADKQKQVDLYENVENVNKEKFAVAGPALVTKQKKTKPAKPPKAPKRNKDGLIYVDLDLKKPVKKSGQKLVIKGLEDRTDYAEIDITRQDDPFTPDDKFRKEKTILCHELCQ